MMQSPFKQLRLHLCYLFGPFPTTKYSLCTGGKSEHLLSSSLYHL